MKLNKKGFTLIELLAVVVILLAISVIAISSISAAIERNKTKQNDAKEKIIVSYAKLYYQSHKNTLPSPGCITIDDLYDAEYIDEDEKVDFDGNELSGVVKYSGGKNFEYVESCPY